ncbi:metal-dependent hydrolase [Halobellus rubicundus]|uniref:Metal-dependent hydrolase n=1 Tax=Halobellus rubicundus TaxID=2996466 RepID=A0ABD5MD34_9EURY
MWPWGHAAVGYLLYASFTYLSDREAPSDVATVVLAIGTQLPDLIDKPLAYSVQVLPEGRSLAHSVLFAVPLCLLVWRVARSAEQWQAFGIGYGSHLIADSYNFILAGRFEMVTFLLWPVLPSPDYPTQSFAGHWVRLFESITSVSINGAIRGELPGVVYQGLLAVSIGILWWSHGRPGTQWAYRWLQNQVS